MSDPLLFFYTLYWSLFLLLFVLLPNKYLFDPSFFYFGGNVFFLLPGFYSGLNILWVRTEENCLLAFACLLLSTLFFTLGSLFLNKNPTTYNHNIRLTVDDRLLLIIFFLALTTRILFDKDNLLSPYFFMLDFIYKTPVGKYLSILAYFPTALGIVGALILVYNTKKDIRSITLCILILLVGVFNLSRTPAFYVLGSVLVYVFSKKSRSLDIKKYIIMRIKYIIVVPLVIYIAITIASIYKESNILLFDEEAKINDVVTKASERKYELAVSDTFGNLLFILDNYPDRFDYYYFLTPLVLFTAFIPREWISSWKPYSSSYYLTQQLLGTGVFEEIGTSLAPSIIGEFYMNGGIFAVVIYSFVFGLIFKILYLKLTAMVPIKLIPAPLLILAFLFARGDSLTILIRGGSFVLIYVLAIKFLIKRNMINVSL